MKAHVPEGMVEFVFHSERFTQGNRSTVVFLVPQSRWGIPAGNLLIQIGIARSNPKDQFNRKLGHSIALGRAITPSRVKPPVVDAEKGIVRVDRKRRHGAVIIPLVKVSSDALEQCYPEMQLKPAITTVMLKAYARSMGWLSEKENNETLLPRP